MTKSHRSRAGFTIIELSIVVVILGLLTGGILMGQSLIRSAEIRSVISDYQKYSSAVKQFRDQYNALPGNMANATSVWGRLNSNADCITNSGAAINGADGTCDGSGNGGVAGIWPLAAGKSGETFQFWRQLKLAGMIVGNFTGVSVGAETLKGYPGINVPTSRIRNSGWGARSMGVYAGDTVVFAADYGNMFTFGVASPFDDCPNEPALTPQEAWQLDTKMDDGKPGTGKVITRYWNNACATAASNTDYSASYNLSGNGNQCAFYFPHSI